MELTQVGINLPVGPSRVRRTKTIGNICIYRPHVFCMRTGFIRYAFTDFHVEVKRDIVSS